MLELRWDALTFWGGGVFWWVDVGCGMEEGQMEGLSVGGGGGKWIY